MEKIRLVIAEDDRVTRETLARLIGIEEDIEIVGLAEDGEQAIGVIRREMPDVVLTDINMPRVNGIEVTQTIKQEMPSTGVVILTIYHDDANVFEAVKAGARGYILKDSPPQETIEAIRTIARGDALLHPSIASRVLGEFTRISRKRAQDPRLKLLAELTTREVEVLKEVATGKRNRQIAQDLFISEKTVKNHISNILFKLEVNDRTEAAMLAAQQGLV
jgi:DNA-binding NarL/FixJ family response regulator